LLELEKARKGGADAKGTLHVSLVFSSAVDDDLAHGHGRHRPRTVRQRRALMEVKGQIARRQRVSRKRRKRQRRGPAR
jgi:hypothetical protein